MKKLLFTILIAFALFGVKSVHADTFGNPTEPGNSVGGILANEDCASSTVPLSGTLNSITIVASSSPTLATTGGVAIRADDGTGTKPATASPLATATYALGTKTSYTVPISTSLTGGTLYWLCGWANGQWNYYYGSSAPPGFKPNSLGSWPTWYSGSTYGSYTVRRMAIYATYTPTTASTKTKRPVPIFF